MKSYFWTAVFLILVAAAVYVLVAWRPAQQGAPGAVPSSVTFYCGAGNSFKATFATSSATLFFPGGESYTLPQTLSGSGIRYEATTSSANLLFTSEGDTGSFTNSASTTDFRYRTCMAANVAPSNTSGYDTYTNLGKTFTFTFPTNFSAAGTEPGYGPGWSVAATTTGMVLAKIAVPMNFEPGTNFGGAWFTVGTSADPSAVATCLMNPMSDQSTAAQVMLGGIPFTELKFSGAAAGNRYDTTSYRTVRNNQCYAVEYTIHYGVFENYPAGAVKKFNEVKVQNALDKVARSFRFLP